MGGLTGNNDRTPDRKPDRTSLAGTEHAMADGQIESKSVSSEALVADIDRTRAELARTIDAISDRACGMVIPGFSRAIEMKLLSSRPWSVTV